ncbi:N-acetyltransferase [Alicyclobacillaceae bacterium I2511]|nr:N-acetyltransferase [Alicyclobacillaceae bacterium I2511]
MLIRKALITDVDPIHDLIQGFAEQGLMLPRNHRSLYEHLQDFTVAVIDNKVVGTAGLHVLWKDLSEVRSLAVSTDQQGLGIGHQLVVATIQEAQRMGIDQVLSLTYQTKFFQKLGFILVRRDSLPHKVWKDCVYCKKFYQCDETALVYYTRSGVAVQQKIAD